MSTRNNLWDFMLRLRIHVGFCHFQRRQWSRPIDVCIRARAVPACGALMFRAIECGNLWGAEERAMRRAAFQAERGLAHFEIWNSQLLRDWRPLLFVTRFFVDNGRGKTGFCLCGNWRLFLDAIQLLCQYLSAEHGPNLGSGLFLNR